MYYKMEKSENRGYEKSQARKKRCRNWGQGEKRG
jgi:hypothetical protein